MSKGQRHLYQGSKTSTAGFVLQGTGTAGIQIDKIPVFFAPDIFPVRFFFDRQIALMTAAFFTR
jgi:hypothetical protein